MKFIGFQILAAILFSSGCFGQANDKGNLDVKPNKPKTSIKVNKEFDKDGNLIRYDSTYSYSYSNNDIDPLLSDSVLNAFKDQFNKSYFFSNEPYFQHYFFNDSLMMNDFYKKDFFINRFRNNSQAMDSLFLKMDKLKNDYFDKQFKEYYYEDKSKK
jgi:hypothetical protein